MNALQRQRLEYREAALSRNWETQKLPTIVGWLVRRCKTNRKIKKKKRASNRQSCKLPLGNFLIRLGTWNPGAFFERDQRTASMMNVRGETRTIAIEETNDRDLTWPIRLAKSISNRRRVLSIFFEKDNIFYVIFAHLLYFTMDSRTIRVTFYGKVIRK